MADIELGTLTYRVRYIVEGDKAVADARAVEQRLQPQGGAGGGGTANPSARNVSPGAGAARTGGGGYGSAANVTPGANLEPFVAGGRNWRDADAPKPPRRGGRSLESGRDTQLGANLYREGGKLFDGPRPVARTSAAVEDGEVEDGPRGRRGNQDAVSRYGARFLALAVGRELIQTAANARRNNIETTLAGTDQAESLKAQLAGRERMGSIGFGMVGLFGTAFGGFGLRGDSPDPFGRTEAHLRATMAAGEAMDEKSKSLGKAAEMRTDAARDAALAGVGGIERVKLKAQQDYEITVGKSADAKRAAAQRDEATILAEETRLKADPKILERARQIRKENNWGWANRPLAIAQAEAELVEPLIRKSRQEAGQARDRDFGPITGSAENLRKSDVRSAELKQAAELAQSAAATKEAFANALGQPAAAQRAALLGTAQGQNLTAAASNLPSADRMAVFLNGLSKIVEVGAENFRNFAGAVGDQSLAATATQKLIDRDPLGAALTGVRSNAESRKRSLLVRMFPGLASGIDNDADLQSKLLTQSDTDARTLIGMNLQTAKSATALQAHGRPIASRADEIFGDAQAAAEHFRQAGGDRAQEFERDALEIGRNRLQTLQRSILERGEAGKAEQTNAFLGGVGLGGQSQFKEDMQQALQETNRKLDEINTSLAGI